MKNQELSTPIIESKPFLPYNLQFFAEEGTGAGEGAGDSGEGEDDDTDDEGEGTGDQNQNKAGEKTLTQAELNTMMKKEKDSGKRAALKALGFKDEKEAKADMEAYKQWKDSQKTEAEKQTEKMNTLTSEKTAAEQKAAYLENKFTAIAEGVKLEAVDDVVVIAMSKVTDDKDLKSVLADMKTNTVYASFFTDSTSDGTSGTSSKGTGTGVNSGKKASASTDGIGARLASANKPTQTTKSSYFSH